MFVAGHITLEEVLRWEKTLSKPSDFRRVRALALALKAWIGKDIGEALDVELRTVHTGIQKYNEDGCAALLNQSTDHSAKRYLRPELE